MNEDELKEAVINRYSKIYPTWNDIHVTTLVPDVFGKTLAVVKALESDGTLTEGEICFVTNEGKVTIFQTTEDLAFALIPELPADPKMLVDAKAEIAEFVSRFRKRHTKNYAMNIVLVSCGIIIALCTTAAGFFNYGTLAGVLGLVVTLFISLQTAFSFSETADFQRLMFTEAENLLSLLKFRVRSQAQFDSVLDAFMKLKKSSATDLPQGKGMDVVREMYGSAPAGMSR